MSHVDTVRSAIVVVALIGALLAGIMQTLKWRGIRGEFGDDLIGGAHEYGDNDA